MRDFKGNMSTCLVGIIVLLLTACSSGSIPPIRPVGIVPAVSAQPISTDSATVSKTQVSVTNPVSGRTYDYAITSAPAHGSASVDSAGLVTYTPDPGYTGNDKLTVTVTDSEVPPKSSDDTIDIVVRNRQPLPTAPDITDTSNTAATSQIAANDPDAGQNYTYTVTTGPQHGTATVNGTGLLSYKADSGYVGNDSVTVEVSDDGSPSKSGTVTIAITVIAPVVNPPPSPTAPNITTNSNTAGNSQIAANDPDAGQSHTYAVTTPPGHGTATIDSAGLVTYTPNTDYTGSDSLIVTVTDSGTPPMSGAVTIRVTVVNQPPAPTAPAITTNSSTPATSQIAVNDPDTGQGHTFSVTTAAAHGLATVDTAGLVTYTPNSGFTGNDTLKVTVSDEGSPVKSGEVTIGVTVVNQPPAPTAPAITTNSSTPATSQIAINDPDTGQGHTFSVTTAAAHGLATVDTAGLVTYTPNSGFTGNDTLKVTVSDEGSPVKSGEVTIGVTVVNQPPAPTAPAITTNSSTPATSQIAVNDPDTGQGHTFSVTTAPAHGLATVDTAGLVTYTPNAGFTGNDTLKVTVTDDGSPAKSGVVTINVTVVNQPPVPSASDIIVYEGAQGTIQVTPNDPDIGQTFSFAITNNPTNGTASVDANGLVSFTPNNGYVGGDSLEVTVTDNGVPQKSGAVTIPITVKKAVTLTITANPDPVIPGKPVTYEVRVSNVSATTLNNIDLTLTEPNDGLIPRTLFTGGIDCSGPPGSNCHSNGLITSTGISLAPGQTQTAGFVLDVNGGTNKPADGTLIHLDATVNYASTSVSASNDVVVQSAPGLQLAMNEDVDPVAPGGQLTYTIDLGNPSSGALPLANDGMLVAAIPTGTTFVSASNGGIQVGNEVQWSIGSVDASARQRYTFAVAVDNTANNGDVLASQASVIVTGGQAVVTGMVSTIVHAAVPLTLTVVANPDPVVTGKPVTYEVRVSNVSATTLNNIDLTLTEPNDGLIPRTLFTGGIDCSGPPDSNCYGDELITSTGISLAPGQTQTVGFVLDVNGGTNKPADGTLIHLDATVNYASTSVSASNDVVVQSAPGLQLAMNEDVDPVAPGGQLTYTFDLGNPSSGASPLANDGMLVAAIPTGTTFVSASNGGIQVGNEVQWSIGSVDASARQRYTFAVAVDNTANNGDVLASQASVIVTGGQAVVTGMVSTIVHAAVPLTLSVSATPDPVQVGNAVTYTIAIMNTSANTLNNVELTLSEPNDGLIPRTLFTGGIDCSGPPDSNCYGDELITSTGISLAPNQVLSMSFVLNVNSGNSAPSPGTLIRERARLDYLGGDVTLGNAVVVGP